MQSEEVKEFPDQKILANYFKNSKLLRDDYVSEKLKPSQKCFKTTELIPKNEVVYGLGGRVVPQENLHIFDIQAQKMKMQFRESIFSIPLIKSEDRSHLKHSCSPNCGILDQIFIVAMKDIQPGQVITFDWAMIGGPYQEKECNCGEPNCRKKLSPKDWNDVHEKYGKYCSDFIKLRAAGKGQKQYDSVMPYKVTEIAADDYSVLTKYAYNPEIRTQDFVSVKCELQENKQMQGQQVRTLQKIPKGRHVATWGGRVFQDLANEQDVNHTIEIHEQFNQGPLIRALSSSDGINHSCNPNLGMRGTLTLVALRDIEPGQLLTFDYCMTDSDDIDNFDCLCKQPTCRGKVGVSQWKNKDIRQRYKGYFSNFIQRKIDQLSD